MAPAICHLGRLVEDEEILRQDLRSSLEHLEGQTMIMRMRPRLVTIVREQVDTEARLSLG